MIEVWHLFVCIIKEFESFYPHQASRRNPIFLYGPSRSGKTTILKGIEDYLSRIKGVRVIRLDAEDIVAELIKSIRNSGDAEEFYYRFHGCDALLIDNIWVLGGNPRTTEEIFGLFKTLIDKGKFLVIAWDIAPETLLQGTRTIKELHKRSVTFKTEP
jgi:chromosomal replication initiation ATPase DnaA